VIARKFDSKAAPYRKFLSDPISLVAAEIHLGKRPAGVYGGWLTLPYSNRVPVQQFRKYCFDSIGCWICGAAWRRAAVNNVAV
jgi:hypothetical protein